MENRIRNFVYSNDNNYTSYDSVKCLFSCICPFVTLIIGVYAVVSKLWILLSVLIAIDCTFLFHLILLKFFFKNTYPLRFLSDGIIDLLLSSLFLTSGYIVLFATECNTDCVTYGALISYVIFVVLNIVLTIVNSQSKKYKNLQPVILKKRFLFIGSLISVSGIIGMFIAKVIFRVFNFGNQLAVYVAFAALMIVSLLFSLGYVNFIKFFYCKKYKIICNKSGENSSPLLNSSPRKKKGQ